MPTKVTAVNGDTLCGLAIEAGFLDCAPLRADAANSAFLTRDLAAGDIVTIPDIDVREVARGTDTTHTFVAENAPPVRIRFTHGSPAIKYLEDADSTVLNVSNYKTTAAGRTANVPFPDQFEFQQPGHDDPDTFKVEVVDPVAGGTVNVVLEAMKPLYQLELDTNQLVVTGHIPFGAGVPTPDMRKIDMECKKVRSSVSFRSRYLRLVVDEKDFEAAPGQTLLVRDLADGRGSGSPADNDTVEILDQQVRASYTRTACPGAAPNKCTVRKLAPVGDLPRKRAKINVHVLKDAGGVLVAPFVDVRRNVMNNVRGLYAQAGMSVRIVDAIEDIPLPANLLAVANGAGAASIGNKTITVRVQIAPAFDQTVSVTTRTARKPIVTATDLADAIQAILPPGITAAPSENPPLAGQTIGSADVLVGDPRTQTITLQVLASGDLKHPVRVGSLTSATVKEFSNADSHVGTLEERVLVKNYKSKRADRLDMFIVGVLSDGSLGEAFIPNRNKAEGLRSKPDMVNSVLIKAETVNKTEFFYTTMPHEMGHVLMDANHALTRTELMVQNRGDLKPQSNERVVNGPKRISDPIEVTYDDGLKGVPVNLLRSRNAGLLEDF